jgi:hypothetical protein
MLIRRLLRIGSLRMHILRDPALIAIWGKEPIANVSELITLAPEINEIASRLAHKRYQPLKANHYRAQHARHWQDEKGQTL